MTAVRSILVDIDAVAADHPALDRAVSLAERCNATLTIVDVLPAVPSGMRDFVTPAIEGELVDHRRARLAAIAAAVRGVGARAELLRGRPATALIREVLRAGHDLLVRSHVRDLAAGPHPFGAVDMELLRHCPCPVWLVPRHEAHRPWRMCAAVHANAGGTTEHALNTAILDWALTLKDIADAELTVLQAWTAYGADVLRSRMPSDDFAQYVEAAHRSEGDALARFLASFAGRLDDVRVELIYGEPEDAIVQYVAAHGIDVVVMGTVARTGIAGVIMGNTAEGVLRRLEGSVLAVKPPGFQTPVTMPAER